MGICVPIKWFYKNDAATIKNYVLGNATIHGYLDIIKWFFANVHPTRKKISWSYRYIMVLHFAAMHGHLNIIKWLQSSEVNRNVRSRVSNWIRTHLLRWATMYGHLHIVEWLWTMHNNQQYDLGCNGNRQPSHPITYYLILMNS
jgi:hypothetical protein